MRRPLAGALLTASLCALPASPASAQAFTATFPASGGTRLRWARSQKATFSGTI